MITEAGVQSALNPEVSVCDECVEKCMLLVLKARFPEFPFRITPKPADVKP